MPDPPHLEPRFTPEDARRYFLGLDPSGHMQHHAPPPHADHAAYKAHVLLNCVQQHYPGARPYVPADDGGLESAKVMQSTWTQDILRDLLEGRPRWGVGGAERGEVFVRPFPEGGKEYIIPAIPQRVVWSKGAQNVEHRGWVACRPETETSTGYLACPAFVLRQHGQGKQVRPQLIKFTKDWKEGRQSSCGSPFGLKIHPRLQYTTYEWQYSPYTTDNARLANHTPTPPTIATWMCKNLSTGAVDRYIFDLELTRKIEELEGQQAHVPVARAGAA
ncbi:hypothetical protein JCM10296v2_003951 [Rhodotorula toruloides]